jgi:hypothetical protein
MHQKLEKKNGVVGLMGYIVQVVEQWVQSPELEKEKKAM